MTSKNRSNQLIECLRFISCVCIMFIHCGFPLPVSLRGYAMAVSRFAVSYLIILSGWYVDHDTGIRKAQKKLKDTARIICIGGLACILWNCANSFFRYGSPSSWIVQYLNRRTVINFLLFNRAVFFNSVFYYFFIMLYVYVIFILAQKTGVTKGLCAVSPLLLVGGIIVSEFSSLPWYYGGNFLLLGIPMFCIGYYLRTKQRVIRALKSREWMFITAGAVLTYLEFRWQGSRYLYVGAIVIAVSVFVFCINHEDAHCPALLTTAGSILSLPMIVIHCEIRDTLQIFFPALGGYGLPLLVLVLSIVLSYGFRKIWRRA